MGFKVSVLSIGKSVHHMCRNNSSIQHFFFFFGHTVQLVGSSFQTRDWTWATAIKGRDPYHLAARELLSIQHLK